MIQPKVYYERGQTYNSEGRWQEAINDYDCAIKLQPDFADAYVARGKTYLKVGRPDAALADFQRAAELAPGNPEAHLNLGQAYQTAHDEAKALNHLRQYVRLAGATAHPKIVELMKIIDANVESEDG
jgi:tetratricopeptide (TPR) repeat protein